MTNIIDKYESFFATAEKAYIEIVKNYESATKKLHTAQEKLTNSEQKWAKEKSTLDDDLKQMKTNYHQSRTDKSELDAEIKLLKAPISKKVEAVLAEIHTAVFGMTRGIKTDVGQSKTYTDSMGNAENAFRLIENQLADYKHTNSTLDTKIKTLDPLLQDLKEQNLKFEFDFGVSNAEIEK